MAVIDDKKFNGSQIKLYGSRVRRPSGLLIWKYQVDQKSPMLH